MNHASFTLRETAFGPVALLWSAQEGEPKILRVVLSRPELSAEKAIRAIAPRAPASSCSEIDALLDQIEAFLNGEAIRFSLTVARLDLCSAFQQSVLCAEHAIPRGRVSTYGLIARRLGKAKGARAVGTALANNPFPIIVPCHRAVRSDGALGGFQGGVKMKHALLEMEGVSFGDADHVATGLFFYGAANGRQGTGRNRPT
jgi:methylated-DNA-[protein]-cysteine S-methyltransferase